MVSRISSEELLSGQEKPQLLFINGRRQEGAGAPIRVVDPSCGSVLCEYRGADAKDAAAAVEAAAAAGRGEWAALTPAARAKLLLALADALEERADEFARVESRNTGKPIQLMRNYELPGSIEMLRYNAGWATKLNGETRDVSIPGTWHAFTLRRPVGVVGLIVPWNNPLMMAVAKLAPALAAGCTAVLKPAEITPLTAVMLGELAREVGIPDGVVNIVPGAGRIVGEAIATHPLVNKVSFTGSTAVGKHLQRLTADSLKRLSLELGGKSPVLIFADADLDAAARSAAMSIFNNSGQVCAAGSRLYVEESVAEEITERIVAVAQQLKLGDVFDETVTMGPLVSEAQRERVLGYIESGIAQGASVATGGAALPREGYFVQPTVLTDVTPEMTVAVEEIFGPVLVIQKFSSADDLESLVARANDNPYGLSAYVWTNNLSRALTLARSLDVGNVRVNTVSGMDPNMPFGGVKDSGYGKENGREGIEAFTELTSVAIKLSE